MKVRVWRFDVPDTVRDEFEREYGPDGSWAVLFRRSAGFLGTELFRDVTRPGSYVTVDRFVGEAAWQAFRAEHAHEYEALGERLAHLTADQEELI
jgi:hypothetical protein